MRRYRQEGHFNGHFFASDAPIAPAQVLERVPSVATETPKPGLSAKYGQIHTRQVLDAFVSKGYLCVGAHQIASRKTELKPYAKHVLQFTRPELKGISLAGEQGDVRVVISNSHDGSGAYIGSLGIFRHRCTNSLVVSLGLGCFRVRHHQHAAEEVIEATYRVLDNIPLLTERVKEFHGKTLGGLSELEFARRASVLRWANEDRPIDPVALLEVRRSADASNSLWHVYNRVQENLVKGGLGYYDNKGSYRHTRAITSPTEVVKVNRQLWELAEEFAAV